MQSPPTTDSILFHDVNKRHYVYRPLADAYNKNDGKSESEGASVSFLVKNDSYELSQRLLNCSLPTTHLQLTECSFHNGF